MVPECLFCKIANSGQNLIWENNYAAAFADIHPKAPVHLLVVPKTHVASLDALDDDVELAGQLMLAVRDVARTAGVSAAYRVAVNNGRAAGQVVEHLHLHVLGHKDVAGFTAAGAEAEVAAGL